MTVDFKVLLARGAAFAPMAGCSDAAARHQMVLQGAVYTVSEMVSAKALTFGDQKSRELLRWSKRPETAPYGVQLFGSDPAILGQATALIRGEDFDFYDVNFGCPAPKVTKSGAGSALLADPARCGAIVEAMVQNAAGRPVTAKLRLGWDAGHITALEVAKACEAAGAAALVVHGRTREEMYRPGIHKDILAAVAQAVSIPVVANGDVRTAEGAVRLAKETGAAGVMIGRAALGDPWLFARAAAAFTGQEPPPEPKLSVRLGVMRAQLTELCRREGERVGISKARGASMRYMQGLRGAAELRRFCSELTYFSDIEELCRRAWDLQQA